MKKQNGKEDKYILDSSAFFALFEYEDGAETVQNLLEEAQKGDIIIFSSFVSYTEVFEIEPIVESGGGQNGTYQTWSSS